MEGQFGPVQRRSLNNCLASAIRHRPADPTLESHFAERLRRFDAVRSQLFRAAGRKAAIEGSMWQYVSSWMAFIKDPVVRDGNNGGVGICYRNMVGYCPETARIERWCAALGGTGSNSGLLVDRSLPGITTVPIFCLRERESDARPITRVRRGGTIHASAKELLVRFGQSTGSSNRLSVSERGRLWGATINDGSSDCWEQWKASAGRGAACHSFALQLRSPGLATKEVLCCLP